MRALYSSWSHLRCFKKFKMYVFLLITSSFTFFIYSCFLKQRFNRVFKKIKNERVIVITEKSRVNKKIRRIFINKDRIIKENIKKKRVNVKFLKCVFFILFVIFFLNRFFLNFVLVLIILILFTNVLKLVSFFLFSKKKLL